MNLEEILSKIDSLNELRVGGSLWSYSSAKLKYNELTFIPFFKENKVNSVNEHAVPLSETINRLDNILNIIKETDHIKFESTADAVDHYSKVAPDYTKKMQVRDVVKNNKELNKAWYNLYLEKMEEFDHFDESITDDLITKREIVEDFAADLQKNYVLINKFLFSYYVLNEQLSKSFLHEEDKGYIIKSINKLVDAIPDIKDFYDSYHKYESANNNYIQTVKNEITKLDPTYLISQAVQFIEQESKIPSDNSLEKFIHTKNISEEVFATLELTSSQKINKVLVFNDNSIAYLKNGVYNTITNNKELEQFNRDVHSDAVSFILRKKPSHIPFFKNKIHEDGVENAIKTVHSLLEHYPVLKQYNFDLNSLKDKNFEGIDDKINNIVYKNKIKQFAYTILSSKYKHHFNEETEPHFKSLYDNKVTSSQLQTFVGKKIAAMKNNEDVINMLTGLLNYFDQFTPEVIDLKLESFGLNKLYADNGIYVFEVKDYEQCVAFGSKSWCIVRDEDYFDQYVTDVNNRQYILCDFNKRSTDIYSMIGFTLDQSGSSYAQHLKNDDELYGSDITKQIEIAQKAALYANREEHSMTESTIDSLESYLKENGVIKENKVKLKQRLS
jgi:hypothetical protein